MHLPIFQQKGKTKMIKPETNKKLTAKWTASGRGKIHGVMLHDTAGTGLHNDTVYISNPSDGRKAGIDFTIERDGTIYELNHDLKTRYAFHASRATRVKLPGITLAGNAVSKGFVGIELCHKLDPKKQLPIWPETQVRAAAALCLWLASEFGFGKEAVITHAKAVTDGSRSDPRDFPFDLFWTIWNQTAGTPAINPQAPGLGMPIFHVVAAGDTLWRLAVRYKTSIDSIRLLNGMEAREETIQIGQKLLVKK